MCQFLCQLPGARETQLSGFKVNEESLDRQKLCFPYEKASIHSFWEILGLSEPTQECGSVGTACSKGTLRQESFGQLNKQAEKPFTLEYFCNYGHQDGSTKNL